MLKDAQGLNGGARKEKFNKDKQKWNCADIGENKKLFEKLIINKGGQTNRNISYVVFALYLFFAFHSVLSFISSDHVNIPYMLVFPQP